MRVLAVLLPALAVLVIALLIGEVRRYRAGRHLVSNRRLALRLASGLLMVALLAAIFIGVFVIKLLDATARPQDFLVFWGSCMGAAFVLMLLMLADVREVEDRSLRREHEIWRDFARFIASQMKRGEESPEAPAEDEGEQ